MTAVIQSGPDVLKMLMAGADVTMLCAAHLINGVGHLRTVEREMREWMEAHEYESVRQMRESMCQINCADPTAFERGQSMRALQTYRPG